jgi:hypothetical protein
MIDDVDQYNDLVMHYHGKVGLVDRLDYKLSTLSSDFKNARMFTFTHENEISLIPIVEFRDTIEVVGQYFGEGYRLAVCRRHWPMIVESLKEQSGKPLNIDYVGERYIGMKEATKQSAVLTLSRPDAMQEYRAMFVNSDDHRILRVVDKYDDCTQIRSFTSPTAADFNFMFDLSIERLGDESYFNRLGPRETFTNLSKWLTGRGWFQGIRYSIDGKEMGIAFFAIDVVTRTLYYLNGFFMNGYDGFGKFMYCSFVHLADVLGLKEINALSPVYRIKKDMRFKPRPLYCL